MVSSSLTPSEMLEHTFKTLHFSVVLRKLLSVDDTLSTLRGIFRQRQNHGGDGFICSIISRGTTSHLLATDSYTAGLRLDMVRHLFTADACPMLAGRCKLLFIQRHSVPKFQPCARSIGMRIWRQMGVMGCSGIIQSLQTQTCTGVTAGWMNINSSQDKDIVALFT